MKRLDGFEGFERLKIFRLLDLKTKTEECPSEQSGGLLSSKESKGVLTGSGEYGIMTSSCGVRK